MPEITATPAAIAVPVHRPIPAPAYTPEPAPDRAPTPDRAPAPPPAPAPTRTPAPDRAPTPPPPREPAETAAAGGAAEATGDPRTPIPTHPCPTCAHPPCRARRSASQPRLYGRTHEFIHEHRTAAAIQAQHRHAVVWFGESTQSYWVATPTGLTEAPDPDTLLLTLWARTSAHNRIR